MEELWGIAFGMATFGAVLLAVASWRIAAVIVLVVAMLDFHLRIYSGIKLQEGMTLLTADIVFAITALAAVIRLVAVHRMDRVRLAWIAVFVFFLFAFFNGVAQYGLFNAIAGYRQFFYLSSGAIYFSSFDLQPRDARWLTRLVVAGATVLMIAGLSLWAWPDWMPNQAEIVLARNLFDHYRVLPAVAAMFMGVAFLLTLPSWLTLDGVLLRRLLGLALLLTVALLYHRTVWAAVLMAWLYLVVALRGRGLILLMALCIGGLLGAVVGMVLSGLGIDSISAPMVSAFSEVGASDSSLAWRVEGWRALVDRAIDRGPLSVLLGAGFGVDFQRSTGFGTSAHSPHSQYVELFLTCGIVGLAVYFTAFFRLIVALRRLAAYPDRNTEGCVLVAVLIAILIYGFSYNHRYDMVLSMAIAFGWIMERGRADRLRQGVPIAAPAAG